MDAERIDTFPTLRTPILVAAFEGWNDAGDAASGAVEHLALLWDAQPIADIDSDDYYDFQVNRPIVEQVDGVARRIVWPSTSISYCRPPGAERDIALLRGIEPNMRWRAFCAEILEIVAELNIETIVILGALLADTAHTRPVPVTGTAFSSESARAYNLQESRYEGPTGITGVLQHECVAAGVPAVSLWAAVPHYISTPPNPKATLALLHRVEEILDIQVPLGELVSQAEEWESSVTEMTQDDDEIADYVRGLEEQGDAEESAADPMGPIDGDALAAEFERYLRRRGPGSFGG